MTLEELRPIADAAALAHNVDALVLLAIWWVESRWQPSAVNPVSKAAGLGQVMPREAGSQFADRPALAELLDPVLNADWSARILRQRLTYRGEDLRAAVKDYSGGWQRTGDEAFERTYWRPFLDKLRDLQRLGRIEMVAYPRPPEDTGAGVHLSAGFAHPMGENEGQFAPLAQELRRRGLTWAKVGDMGGTAIKPCQVLLDHGIMPVVRMYRPAPYPGRLDEKQRQTVLTLARMGVRYIERGNEPNLLEEHQGWPASWNEWFLAWARDWYSDAQVITDAGGYVAIDALAPGGNWHNNQLVWSNGDDIGFLSRMLRALKLTEGAVSLLRDRGWVSIHPATLNHPLDYPADEVNQREHPGQTVHTHYYPNGTASGASNGWRKWEAVHQVVMEALGFSVPLIGTEGGAWPGNCADARYPALTNEVASEMNYETLASMRSAPGYVLAHMPWLLFNRIAGNLAPHFERDAWLRVPGYGNCPAGDPAELPIWRMLADRQLQPRAASWGTDVASGPTPAGLEEYIGALMQAHVIPLSPDAAFEKAGAAKGMLPASDEVDLTWEGANYRAQVYRHPHHRGVQHIVYARIGEWDRLHWFERQN